MTQEQGTPTRDEQPVPTRERILAILRDECALYTKASADREANRRDPKTGPRMRFKLSAIQDAIERIETETAAEPGDCRDVREAAEALVASVRPARWNTDDLVGEDEGYWSPAAQMVKMEHVEALRQALRQGGGS